MISVNVAQLMRAPTGTVREFAFCDADVPFVEELRLRSAVRGTARLVRTGRGILVTSDFSAQVEVTCARCTEDVVSLVEGHMEEEFLKHDDFSDGDPLAASDDTEFFRIDEHNTLDLTEAVRQYLTMALPLQPLCKPSCQGLCPECGANLNTKPCGCRIDASASPFAVLGTLLESS
ncbi:MAG TPA: DUF177 domain-containing protein [Chloroflexota bacterium]|jgi:uncharacterized protein